MSEPVSDAELAEAARLRLPVAGPDLELARVMYTVYGEHPTALTSWVHEKAQRHRDLLRLVELRTEQKRRAGAPPPEVTQERRLWWLLYEGFLRKLFRDEERQRRACEALEAPWPPPDPEPPLSESSARLSVFVWCWESQPADVWAHGAQGKLDLSPVPLLYPHDWTRDEIEPDLYGCGDDWREGEVLVVAAEDVPAIGEIVDEPVRARRVEQDPPREAAPARALRAPRAIEAADDEDAADDEPDEPAESFAGERDLAAFLNDVGTGRLDRPGGYP